MPDLSDKSETGWGSMGMRNLPVTLNGKWEHKDRDDCDNGDRDGKPNPTLHLYK